MIPKDLEYSLDPGKLDPNKALIIFEHLNEVQVYWLSIQPYLRNPEYRIVKKDTIYPGPLEIWDDQAIEEFLEGDEDYKFLIVGNSSTLKGSLESKLEDLISLYLIESENDQKKYLELEENKAVGLDTKMPPQNIYDNREEEYDEELDEDDLRGYFGCD